MRLLAGIRRVMARVLRVLLVALGSLGLVLVLLSFTDVPYRAYHRLGMPEQRLSGEPDVITVLGGAGMPSPDGLIRTYYAAAVAARFPSAVIVIALPAGEGKDSLYQLQLMARELIQRGVEPQRIRFESQGINTHSQAENIALFFGSQRSELALLVVTSPEHVYRAVCCFEREGFGEVGGMPAFGVAPGEKGLTDEERPGAMPVPGLALRYNMWSYLHYELLVLREYCAIAYYWINGWI